MKKKLRFKKIRSRLIFWFLIVALLPLGIVSIISYQHRVESIEKRSFDKLIAIRELKIRELNSWIDAKINNIKTMAQDPEIKSLEYLFNKKAFTQNEREIFQSVRENLHRHIENHRDYLEIYILDPSTGKIEISTNKIFEGENRSQNLYFKETLRTGKLYIKDIFYSKNLHTPSMTFSIPIRCRLHKEKHIVGVLVIRIDLNNSIYDIVSENSGLGETGETVLVNENLMALNALRGYQAAPLKIKINAKPAVLGSQKQTGLVKATDYRGEAVLAAYGYIPKTNWGLVIKQDFVEINAPLKTMLLDFFFMLVISLIAILFAAVFLSKNITNPVLEMAEVSKKIQQGEMSARNHTFSDDEFGVLSQTFNTMADSLASQMKIQQAGTDITEAMVSASDIEMFRKLLLEKLMTATSSDLGAYYIKKQGGSTFENYYSIGVSPEHLEAFDASVFEGQFGKPLTTGEISYIKNIQEDTFLKFKTFTGPALPKEIITIPVVVDKKVCSFISIASLRSYSKEVPEILGKVWLTINVACSNLLANEKTKKFASALGDKNRELNAQAKQLKSQTYELRQQSKELQSQNVELEIKRQQVEEANRLKSQFLSTMSHELRTPLNSIMALSRVLLMQAKQKISEEESNYLEIIERNGKNLLALINDILDLSKIEAGRMDLNPKNFSLVSLVEMIMERLEPIAARKTIILDAKFPENLPEINSDETRIHQILQNIISNAVKFTEKGSVAVSAEYDSKSIYITVADTGIGIPREHIPYIFEEFRQVDGSSSRKYDGTGLGLAIAYKSAKMLGGNITVKSTPEEGTTFTICLPIEWTDTPSFHHPVSLKTSVHLKSEKKTILVIDDDPEAVNMICQSLSEEGYNTVSATSGKEAIALLEHHRPFAITLDIVMPDMDGWEVMQSLKKNPDTKNIPVIIVSVSNDKETGFALGAVGYVTKPITKEMLISEIYKITRMDKPLSKSFDILVVDDNEFEREEMVNIVRSQGMNAIAAEDGRQCIELMKDGNPDVLVLDLVMPEMDGFQVLDNIRKNPETIKLPVIIVTAKDLTDADREKLNGNVSSVLEKRDTASIVLLEEIKNILADIEMKEKFKEIRNPVLKKENRLLLVEDNEAAILQILTFLEDEGYKVDITRDGQEALDYINRFTPDGVVLDLMIPKINGFELLEKFRQTPKMATTPILVLTAKDLSSEDLDMLRNNNVRHFIQKGNIDREHLLLKINSMFDQKPVEEQTDRSEKSEKAVSPEDKTHKETYRKSETQNIETSTILVIEDNPDNMVSIRAVLKNKYNLIEAVDGESGLEAVHEKQPDLILMDMALPKLDGLAVVENIRKDKRVSHIPIIAITAQAMKGDKENIISAGCNAYISKPFDPAVLLEKIDKWLMNSQ